MDESSISELDVKIAEKKRARSVSLIENQPKSPHTPLSKFAYLDDEAFKELFNTKSELCEELTNNENLSKENELLKVSSLCSF